MNTTRHRLGQVVLGLSFVWISAAGLARAADAGVTNADPVVITAGADWVPLKPELDIEPGSALDFSTLGLQDAPAGKHGRVIARPDGQFAFAKKPAEIQRFYGVNFCFGAQYLAPDEADRLADRLMRCGYNAVRIHHYERDLTSGQTDSTRLNPAKLDQLDYLLAAFAKRGLYITTDLFVSRPIQYADIGSDKGGAVPMDTFKILVPVHDGAWKNWQAFSRNLLTHVNPYTQRRYAEDPALAWLSMINEGNFGNFFSVLKTFPEWKTAWNRWLAQQYAGRKALAESWKDELKETEDAANSSVELPENLNKNSLRVRDCIAFFAATEQDMIRRMKAFLRDELHCEALITDANAWTNFTVDQGSRGLFDYVDDHFYVDHPEFLQGSWRLPSRSSNKSPILGGAAVGRVHAFTRLLDKPFTITEYNYSGPGRFRGVGGILTGALGALQGWGGLWRFAYSHSRPAIFTPSPMGYFDMAGDPLSQAAERASICLFLRGDAQTAPHSVAVVMTTNDLAHPPARIPRMAPNWHWAAWVTRLGMQVVADPAAPLTHTAALPIGWQNAAADYKAAKVSSLNPYATDDAAIMALLKERGILTADNPTDPAQSLLRSETGEITIDAPRNILLLDTARTAGGYAPAGETLALPKGGVTIKVLASDATVWVSSLDQAPILKSRRLLVTHLTDLQNTDIKYAEAARQTLLEWGHLPHLVRAGQAEVRLRLNDTDQFKVWALSPGGKRLAEVPSKHAQGELQFTADVAGAPNDGARMLYEIAMK